MRLAPLADWLATQLANREASQFVCACAWAEVAPGIREAARWRRGEVPALLAAWRRWPRSRTLPRQAETLAETPKFPLDHPGNRDRIRTHLESGDVAAAQAVILESLA
jgi:hypothetical protein